MQYQLEVKMSRFLIKNGAILLIDNAQCPEGYEIIVSLELPTQKRKRKIAIPKEKIQQTELLKELGKKANWALERWARDVRKIEWHNKRSR